MAESVPRKLRHVARASAPDTGRTPMCAPGEPSAAAFGAVADAEIRKAFAAMPRDDFPPRDP